MKVSFNLITVPFEAFFSHLLENIAKIELGFQNNPMTASSSYFSSKDIVFSNY